MWFAGRLQLNDLPSVAQLIKLVDRIPFEQSFGVFRCAAINSFPLSAFAVTGCVGASSILAAGGILAVATAGGLILMAVMGIAMGIKAGLQAHRDQIPAAQLKELKENLREHLYRLQNNMNTDATRSKIKANLDDLDTTFPPTNYRNHLEFLASGGA
jgi:hypothetical protein